MPRVQSMVYLALLAFWIAGCGGTAESPPAPGTSSATSAAGGLAEEPHPVESSRSAQRSRQYHSEPCAVSSATRFRAGTLTAGSLDDHLKFDEYSAYLSQVLEHAGQQGPPQFSIGRRAVVNVLNEQGEPIGDARVVIRPAQSPDLAAARRARASAVPAAEWEMSTGADGHVVFLSGLDAPAGGSEFVLTVTPPGGGQTIMRRVSLDQTPWQVTLSQARRVLPQQLDLVLVIDTTGSMADELDYLKAEIDHIVAEIEGRFPNVDQRFGIVLYRDQGDEYVTRSFDFSCSLSDFRASLAAQSAAGGGDDPEAMHLALEQSAQLSWRGSGTARVLFLVTDAPPHRQFAQRAVDAAQKLRRQGITVFPIAASGARQEAEFILRAIGFLTQGKYLFLTDHSGVGNAHAMPHAPGYFVETLDQLLIRMIAEKLSGKPSLAQDVIAVEEPAQSAAADPAATPSPRGAAGVAQPAASAAGTTRPTQLASRPAALQLQDVDDGFVSWADSEWAGVAQILAFACTAALLMLVEREQGV